MENIKKVVVEFKRRVNTEVRKQEKIDRVEERDFRRGELPEKYIAKILYRWDNGIFENKYLKKLGKVERKRQDNIERRSKFLQK